MELLVDIIDQKSLLVGSKLMEFDLVIKNEGQFVAYFMFRILSSPLSSIYLPSYVFESYDWIDLLMISACAA